jgi:hypothetical protein
MMTSNQGGVKQNEDEERIKRRVGQGRAGQGSK